MNKLRVKKLLREDLDIAPEMLIMAGHNPNNLTYVWYYDEGSKKVIGSFRSGSHDDPEFASIANKDKAIRGRVFDYNGKTFLIIYGIIAGFRNPNIEEVRDIYLQVTDLYKKPIDYVVGEEGKDLSGMLDQK